MHLKQLMTLKSRGRYLQETTLFELDNKTLPSLQSQEKVVSVKSIYQHSLFKQKQQLQYQTDDLKQDVWQQIRRANSIEKKNQIVSDRINSEYFYFNPVYKNLLEKRELIMRQDSICHESQKVKDFLGAFPSVSLSVRYKKDRTVLKGKEQNFRKCR